MPKPWCEAIFQEFPNSGKECVSLNQSILKLRLFTYFLLDKKIWWFLSAVLSKMTLPNKSSPKNENRNEFISHFVDMLGLYQ